MKPFKFLLCIFAVIIMFSVPLLPVERKATAATARYARADSDDVYFCLSDDLSSARFKIPYTYCVEILANDGDWYYVKYAENADPYEELYGYCLKDSLTPVTEPPENIYLHMPVNLPFSPSDPVDSMPALGAHDVTVAFYGSITNGATVYHYIGYKGDFGYTKMDIGDYPLNDIPQPLQPTSGTKRKIDAKWIAFLVILAVAAAAVLALYFTGRKRRFNAQ